MTGIELAFIGLCIWGVMVLLILGVLLYMAIFKGENIISNIPTMIEPVNYKEDDK